MVSFEPKTHFAAAREAMVRNHLMARDITDPAVLEAMRTVPREAFVPPAYSAQAYDDNPLPIGMGQTISQPYIVALMTQALQVNKNCRVLEIGTGSGYQTAILAKLAQRVYTIERFGELAEGAQAVLARLGIDNVEFMIGDGSAGWPEHSPYDRIILTAAAPNIPAPLVEQLADGGILVAPIGDAVAQTLVAAKKRGNQLTTDYLCGCRFVKLIGKYGFADNAENAQP